VRTAHALQTDKRHSQNPQRTHDGAWIYQKHPASAVYGDDTISIRRDESTGEIIMGALRADVPVLLRLNPADATMHHAYASQWPILVHLQLSVIVTVCKPRR
jgi:hypothetical protein